MKKIYKVLMFGIMLAVLAVGSAVPSFAQGDPQKEKEALYAKYIDNYDKSIEKRKIAVQAGKEYLQKFGNGDASADPLIPYFKENVPVIEQTIKEAEKKAADDAAAAAATAATAATAEKRAKDFNTGIVSKNWQQAFAAGKEIVDNNPKFLDVYIVLATVGYDRAVEANKPNSTNTKTFNDEAIDYAKKSIQLINNGEKSENYGASFGDKGKDGFYQYNNKENALGWLNYNIGYIMTYNQKKPKEALPYLFEATKHESEPQKSADLYRTIGEYYLNQVADLEKERQALRTSLGNKDNEKTLELFAMQKGFADRGMDAYARAYNRAEGEAKTGLYDRFKKLYTFRNNGKDDGADSYLPTVTTKPLPNPATPVQPIVDEADKEIPTTDATAPATTTDKPAMTDKDKSMKPMDKTKPAMTDKDKPATTDKTKPATTPTKPADSMMKKPAAKPKKS